MPRITEDEINEVAGDLRAVRTDDELSLTAVTLQRVVSSLQAAVRDGKADPNVDITPLEFAKDAYETALYTTQRAQQLPA